MKKNISENWKIASNYQEKTHFFILSLIFTTLAFSIQTAKFSGSLESQLCELLAWLYLLVSGFCELSVLICYPRYLNLSAMKSDLIDRKDIKEENGEIIRIQLENINNLIDGVKKVIKKNSIIHLWFGSLGFVSLVIARGYDPFTKIFGLK